MVGLQLEVEDGKLIISRSLQRFSGAWLSL